jgi:hypothetical protein
VKSFQCCPVCPTLSRVLTEKVPFKPNHLPYTHTLQSNLVGTICNSVNSPVSLISPDLSITSLFLRKGSSTYQCLFQLSYSSWNPPTGNRRLQGIFISTGRLVDTLGDIFYIEVSTLEGETLTITSWRNGFFVNNTTKERFDPGPHPVYRARSHSLALLLSSISPLFRGNFQKLIVR